MKIFFKNIYPQQEKMKKRGLRNCFDFVLHKIYDGFFSETRQILQTLFILCRKI